MKFKYYVFLTIWVLLFAPPVGAYPLDGFTHTGIVRLEALRLAQLGEIRGPKRNIGAKLALEQVDIRLDGFGPISIPEPDPDLSRKIKALLGKNADKYGIALLDVTNGSAPKYAAVNDRMRANVGSVGKMIVCLALFQALADIYPDDVGKRMEILRNTRVVADDFILSDHHKVPMWEGQKSPVRYRPIKKGDTASLWTYLDWMMSASSNAAAAMVQKELLLMNQFKDKYPVPASQADQFFKTTPKKQLKNLLAQSLQTPVSRNGLDLENIRQGSFFTWNGKKKVPGTTSYANPATLVHFLLKLEQGLLVDQFSSREIKRLLYMTGKRIRYASSHALYRSAVYFKSGSLYKCRQEPGFTCEKYKGNVLNQLGSVAIIESPASAPQMHYIVAVMSNVLYENSAVAHQSLATWLHRLMEREHKNR